jgi:hypothetical protein
MGQKELVHEQTGEEAYQGLLNPVLSENDKKKEQYQVYA